VQFLDPNKGGRLESSTGRVASRDVIQFAPMKDVHGMCFSILFDEILTVAFKGKSFIFHISSHPCIFCLCFLVHMILFLELHLDSEAI
jgi:hypothetical protein